jgi:AraC-like DNA-binding protein
MNPAGLQNQISRARITVSRTRAAYLGPSLNLSPHRNLAATVAIALQSPFELRFFDASRSGSSVSTERMAVIEPGVLHQLRASGEMIFLYLDALSDDFAQVRNWDISTVQARLMLKQPNCVWNMDVDSLCQAVGIATLPSRSERISQVVRSIDEQPQAFVRVSDAAALLDVSSSRFQYLFRVAVGMPFRRYRLWRRMRVVLRVIADGGTLTTAAFEAGFSSSAHFSTTFRETFGLSPSALISLGANIEFS